MRSYPNIEKSAFHRGAYVGYGGSLVWRITESTSSYGNWAARPVPDNQRIPTLFALSLSDMSEKLALRAEYYSQENA